MKYSLSKQAPELVCGNFTGMENNGKAWNSLELRVSHQVCIIWFLILFSLVLFLLLILKPFIPRYFSKRGYYHFLLK